MYPVTCNPTNHLDWIFGCILLCRLRTLIIFLYIPLEDPHGSIYPAATTSPPMLTCSSFRSLHCPRSPLTFTEALRFGARLGDEASRCIFDNDSILQNTLALMRMNPVEAASRGGVQQNGDKGTDALAWEKPLVGVVKPLTDAPPSAVHVGRSDQEPRRSW